MAKQIITITVDDDGLSEDDKYVLMHATAICRGRNGFTVEPEAEVIAALVAG